MIVSQRNPSLAGFGIEIGQDGRRGKRRLPPAGWQDPDLQKPGEGGPGPGCGEFFTLTCSQDASHPTERGVHECKTRRCPHCATERKQEPPTEQDAAQIIRRAFEELVEEDLDRDPQRPNVGAWLKHAVRSSAAQIDYAFRLETSRPTPKGNGRLDTDGHRMDLRKAKIYHIEISIPPRAFGYTRSEEREVRRKLIKRLRERGIYDFKMWMHPWRHGGGDASDPATYNKMGLHYHVVGVSRWLMFGQLKKAARGRPPATPPERTLHAFDGKHWGPLRSRRVAVPPEEAAWKVLSHTVPVGRGFLTVNRDRGTAKMRSTHGFVSYLQKVIKYNFHHCGFYGAFFVPDEERFGRMTFKRIKGRHATPSVMAYGTCRKPKDDDPLWQDVLALWGPAKPQCDVCGAPMFEIYDDPMGPAARVAARLHGLN